MFFRIFPFASAGVCFTMISKKTQVLHGVSTLYPTYYQEIAHAGNCAARESRIIKKHNVSVAKTSTKNTCNACQP